MKNLLLFLFISIVLLSFDQNSMAGESSCVTAYGRGVQSAERAGDSAQSGDNCGAADGIEQAINWLGTAEEECAYDRSKLREVLKLKKQLIPLLAVYVQKCGY